MPTIRGEAPKWQGITPLSWFKELGWWSKRDDLAFFTGEDFPSGGKVRLLWKAAAREPAATILVACAASSATQVCAASVANNLGRSSVIFVAARAERTAATEYAISAGADVREVRPGYYSVCSSRAAKFARETTCIGLEPLGIAREAMGQARNLPTLIRRVVVPTGNGSTAAGVLAGLVARGRRVPVLCVAVSGMADKKWIEETAGELAGRSAKGLVEIARAEEKYDQWKAGKLPDGAVLDPIYGAKALRFVKEGDVFFIPNRRPLAAMPRGVREALRNL